jgi:hypothetical protein
LKGNTGGAAEKPRAQVQSEIFDFAGRSEGWNRFGTG